MDVLGILAKRYPLIWCAPHSKQWWEAVQVGTFGEDWWKKNLCISYRTFNIICNQLHPYIQGNNTNLRYLISVKIRIAINIWKLSTNIEYRTLSELFGIGRSTVREIVHDTCQHIVMNLLPKYVKVPKGDRLKELVESFELTKGVFTGHLCH